MATEQLSLADLDDNDGVGIKEEGSQTEPIQDQEEEEEPKEEEEEESKKKDGEEEDEGSDNDEEEEEESSKKTDTDQGEEEQEDDDIYAGINSHLNWEPEEKYEDTPEGYAKYTEDYGRHVASLVEANLQQKYPRAYAYLIHQMNGGDDTEFFSSQQQTDWSKIELSEEDTETQMKIIRDSLSASGWKDKKIDRWIESLEDDGELFNEAKEHLDKNKAAYEKSEQERIKKIKAVDEKKRNQITEMSGAIDQMISKGNIGNLTIPIKERSKFNQYVKQNVVYRDGKFYLNRELDPASLDTELANEFFRFRGGKLDDLVTRRAKTESVRRLKRGTGKKPLTRKQTSSIKTLSDIM